MSTETDYVNNKLDGFQKELDNTETKVGIKYLCVNPLAEKTMSLSIDEINKMSALECSIAKMTLSQHALFIQKQINRATAIKNWANRNIDVIVNQIVVYDGTFFKYEVRRDQIIKNNSYASRLNDVLLEQQAVIDSLSYIAKSVADIASSVSTIYSAKAAMEYGNN